MLYHYIFLVIVLKKIFHRTELVSYCSFVEIRGLTWGQDNNKNNACPFLSFNIRRNSYQALYISGQ